MVEKMGKRCGAMGFAIYLNELERLGPARPQYDADVLVLYDDTTDLQALTRRLAALAGQGSGALARRQAEGLQGKRDPGSERRETGMKEFLNRGPAQGPAGRGGVRYVRPGGLSCEELLDPKRKLIFENPEAGVRYFWVKTLRRAGVRGAGGRRRGGGREGHPPGVRPGHLRTAGPERGQVPDVRGRQNGFRDDPDRTLRVATGFQHHPDLLRRPAGTLTSSASTGPLRSRRS